MSILRKMIIIYVLVVLLPILAIGALAFQYTQSTIREELLLDRKQNLKLVTESINSKFTTIQTVASSIAYNVRLRNFLKLDFMLMPYTLELYNLHIMSIITYARNYSFGDLYNVSIYMNNTSIPEIWNTFYWEDRIKEKNWYSSLTEGDLDAMWIYPHTADHFKRRTNQNMTPVFTWVQKITAANGRHLGIVALDVCENHLFSAIENAYNDENQIILVNGNGNVLYGKVSDEYITQVFPREILTLNGGNFILTENELFVAQDLKFADLYLISITNVAEVLSAARLLGSGILIVFLIGIFILIIFVIFLMRSLYSKFDQILKIMDMVALGDFTIRVPVVRGDILGKLAEDFNILIEKINALVKENVNREKARKDAQLMALQYQINPHFIYNSIDLFRSKMEVARHYKTADAITAFGKMMRYNMSNQAIYATIREELDNVENFMNLQKFSYGDRISFRIEADPTVLDFTVIKFIIQPLVENSIRHGITTRDQKLSVCVTVKKIGKNLVFCIEDNGVGIEQEKLKELNEKMKHETSENNQDSSENIGLININRRIKLFYGEHSSIEIASNPGEFSRIIIRIPISSNSEEFSDV